MHPANQWVRFRSVAYCTGRGLSYGAATEALLPQQARDLHKYLINIDNVRNSQVSVCDDNLSGFANGEYNFGVLGPNLALAADRSLLTHEMVAKLRVGAHLIVWVQAEHFPTYAEVDALVAPTGSWQTKDRLTRNDQHLLIYKLRGRGTGIAPARPRSAKRACIVRYGAMGDMIMVTPLIRRLAEDGFEVTINCTPWSAPILANNPYVSNILVQEREAIPNLDLGQYWDEWKGEYDRYINLSESIEGRLLKVEGRPDFYSPLAWRHATCNLNYHDHTMTLGGYPDVKGTRGELYFTRREEKEAARTRAAHARSFLILWALNGSSYHKAYPMMEPMLLEWLPTHPLAHIITVGDGQARALEFEHSQVTCTAGRQSVRQSLALVPLADCVVGPETMMLNAAGCYDTPKVLFLSHSSIENLSKYWTNCHNLTPNPLVAPCYGSGGCHQLHYTRESCPIGTVRDTEDGEAVGSAPVCSLAISPYTVMATLDAIYDEWRSHQHPSVSI